jgi:hypothetical protein
MILAGISCSSLQRLRLRPQKQDQFLVIFLLQGLPAICRKVDALFMKSSARRLRALEQPDPPEKVPEPAPVGGAERILHLGDPAFPDKESLL